MKFKELSIKGVHEITLEPFRDHRGFFMRTYDGEIFKKTGLQNKWIQESHSFSRKKFTVRGFHFQNSPFEETKLIRVPQGKVLFTVLDLRKDSSTLGKWTQLEVSAAKNNMIYIPRGCAPCMCTLTNNCHLLYKMDTPFNPESYDNILWNDPELGISWPVKTPADISDKDSKAQTFKEFMSKYKGLGTK
jgi:dTDP-4-dehydrorhamnose 3,5-epimerase